MFKFFKTNRTSTLLLSVKELNKNYFLNIKNELLLMTFYGVFFGVRLLNLCEPMFLP